MPRERLAPRRSPLLLLLVIAGCAGPRLAVDDVLGGTEHGNGAPLSPASDSDAMLSLADFDAAATAARERAADPNAAPDTLVAASRALFFAANARMQSATLAASDARPDATLEELLTIDDRASDEARAQVEALTREGRDSAQRALDVEPQHSGALLYHASNTCLHAWSVGTRRALFDGLGGDCDDATEAAMADDPIREGAAPLRLRGRFFSKAPWPVGDREEGLRLLRLAAEAAPVCVNLLFLGDALHASGDEDGASDAWRRAVEAPGDGDADLLVEVRRELARRRLAAADLTAR